MGESNDGFEDAMEPVEEGQNQVPNPIEFMEEEDRISALPDYLLVEILSHLHCIESAIRAGTLSKRWKGLWTLIPTLTIFNNSDGDILDFVSSVTKTLTQRPQFKLKKFQVNICYDAQYESQVKSWIRYAISCNVEKLRLTLCNKDCKAEFVLDQSFFLCSCFTNLRLGCCLFNPVGAISWKNLRKLCIRWVSLDEDLIENILSGSPQLESLILTSCYGFRRLNITSKSVKDLVFCGYYDRNAGVSDYIIIEINAPNILSLAIQGDLDLQKLLVVNVSSLVTANLDYFTYKVTMPEEAEEEMLKGLILNLSHAKDLHIWTLCSKVLSRLEAKGFIFPSNMKLFSDAYFLSAF